MAASVDALDYVNRPEKYPPRPVVVLHGDEAFLQRQALGKLRQQVVPGPDAEFSLVTLAGDDTELRDALEELASIAMFGGQRLVTIEDADGFVSRHRAALEQYVARPKSSAVLALIVRGWPSNTRLAKLVAEVGLPIECKFPTPAKLVKWLVASAQARDGARLDADSAETLIEHVEPDLGLLDQELAKLAALVGPKGVIDAALIESSVGGWRTKTAWDLLDAALNGQTSEALVQLDRLLLAGEAPIALLGQVAASLRRFGAATRLVEQAEAVGRKINLRAALEGAGFKPFAIGKAEPQLRRLGRNRARELYAWLLAADLALKGASSSPSRGRLLLEQFVVRLSAPAAG